MSEPVILDDRWLEAAAAATATRSGSGLHGSAELKQGDDGSLSINVDDGRITGPCEGTPDVVFPMTREQVQQYLAGELDLSVAYMKGDLKPEGSTGALLCVLEVLGWIGSNGYSKG